jgi:hypothetical protein
MLLVEVLDDKQAESLLIVQLLGSYTVQVEYHVSSNCSQTVVNTNSLHGMTDKIQVALANKFMAFPLHTILLMFDNSTLPTPYKLGMK